MSKRLWLAALTAAVLAGCQSAPPDPATRELNALAPLRKTYDGVVAGFDVREDATLVVSVDLQGYQDQDDVTNDAMRRDVIAQWCKAWSAAHPGARAELHTNFIDFIGRTVAKNTAGCGR